MTRKVGKKRTKGLQIGEESSVDLGMWGTEKVSVKEVNNCVSFVVMAISTKTGGN